MTGRRPGSLKESLCERLKAAGESQGWWNASGILVALSGGGDSMALLSLLRIAFKGRIAAAHLEHGLRGASSLADAEFVKSYCRGAGVECFTASGDIPANRLKGESDETAGRRIRYEFFARVSEREGLPFIATAHNAGDVVETVAHRVFRGAGVAGMSGISPRRGAIVRPLINCGREELRRFLRESGVPWREDETNEENHYVRNRIRNQLLPWVRSNINEAADGAVLGFAGECAAISSELKRDAEGLLPLISRTHPFADAAWDAEAARRLSAARLSAALREQGARISLPVLDRRRTEELAGLIRRGGRWRFQWALDAEVCGGGSLIGWIKRKFLTPPDDVEIVLETPSRTSADWGVWRMEFSVVPASEARPRKGVWSAAFSVRSLPRAIKISSAAAAGGLEILPRIPWWAAYNFPVVAPPDGNEKWIPGTRYFVRNSGDYVIIAKAFRFEGRTPEGEKF
jgi:tRNA(Ile)-lysidine synthase